MKTAKIEKLSIKTIADKARNSPDIEAARVEMAAIIGSKLEVSGAVRKVVRREGQSKFVIESADAPGFVVFAHWESLDNLKKLKIRKGSQVTVKGSLLAFGTGAVNLSACRLV